MGAEKQSSKGQAWWEEDKDYNSQIMNLKMFIFFCFFECRFCSTGLSSDMEVEVDDMTYHLNKV